MRVMTLERLANIVAVNDVVGRRPSRRWTRAIPVIRRYDGSSVAGWFMAHEADQRVRLVRHAILEARPWSPLLRVSIPKRGGARRHIDMPTVLDAAVIYLLQDWLQAHAERVLTKVAVAFRPGRSFSATVLNVHQRLRRLPFASVIDIKSFFDGIAWSRVDGVVDDLTADEPVKERLRDLVRAEVHDRTTKERIARSAGIPQGLSVSPVLANLVLAAFDRDVARALGKHRAMVTRYCDDILLLAPGLQALEIASAIVRDRLAALGLAVKHGTGALVNTRQEPVRWLGLSLTPSAIDVPIEVIEAKAENLQAKLDAGLLDPEAIEEALQQRGNHYRRLIGQIQADRVMASIRERIHVGSPPRTDGRKEGLERLHYVVTDR